MTNTGLDVSYLLELSMSRAAQSMVLYKIRVASSSSSFSLLNTTLVTENTVSALQGSVWALM